MKFLVDECTGPAVATWLRKEGYEVFSVFDEARGLGDDKILAKSYAEGWILITNDKDFGEMVYRKNYPHCGIIFLRLNSQRAVVKIEALKRLLATYTETATGLFHCRE